MFPGNNNAASSGGRRDLGTSTTSSAVSRLHAFGQSIWLDDITRDLLDSGTLERYIAEFSVTGLTSNPTIFDHAIKNGSSYDSDIRNLLASVPGHEALLFELIVHDLSRAADLFLPTHRRTATVDGWVSLEVSPLLARDTKGTVQSARVLFEKAGRKNLFIKIPGTREGLPAIEESIFNGVPINVTLLFSSAQYAAAADAYMKGLERRIEAGRSPDIRSVASIFVSRWDVAVAKTVPGSLKNKLGLAIGQLAYATYFDLLNSDRWQALEGFGARPQRLLFASTGTKDPEASDVLYVEGLTAPNTVNTMPQATLMAFAEHGTIGAAPSRDVRDATARLGDFQKAGIDLSALAEKLQRDGADSFTHSWQDLLNTIETKSLSLK